MRICWAQYAMWAVIMVLGIASMLSGCGAKGPLYMPKETVEAAKQQAKVPPASETPAATDDDTNEQQQ